MSEQLYSRTIFTIVVCITLFNGLRLIFSKSVREAYYKKYRITSYFLAAACFCLALGNIIPAFFIGLDKMPDEPFSIITSSIAASQLVLLASALVFLYTNNKNTNGRLLLWSSIYLIFPLLYILFTQAQSDVTTHNLKDYFALLPNNVPAVIRFIYVIIYIVGLFHFTRIFFRERHAYIRDIQKATDLLTREIKLDWVKYAFISALIEGSLAAILIILPLPVIDVTFWIISIIFYAVFPFYYISYGKTYNKVKKQIDNCNSSSNTTEENEGMDQMIARFIQRNNVLFEKTEAIIIQEKPFLDPNFSINDLIISLCTNRTYLANAIRQNTNLTIGDYILQLRLNHAQEMLRNTEYQGMKIEEIALASGFNSLRTFYRNFKNSFGLTPDDYRNY